MPKPKLARPVDIFNFRLTSLALFSLFLSFLSVLLCFTKLYPSTTSPCTSPINFLVATFFMVLFVKITVATLSVSPPSLQRGCGLLSV